MIEDTESDSFLLRVAQKKLEESVLLIREARVALIKMTDEHRPAHSIGEVLNTCKRAEQISEDLRSLRESLTGEFFDESN